MSSLLNKNWKVMSKGDDKKNLSLKDIEKILFENRLLKSKKEREEFINPIHPKDIKLEDLDISKKEINKAIDRITKAKENKERVIVYGDYDADGICATAILWEALFKMKVNAIPYLPDRFSEGYGLNATSIKKLMDKEGKIGLIITVDNGVAAIDAVAFANKNKIDVIVTDHHQKGDKLPKAFSIIHTTKTSGSAVAWILARELGNTDNLELAAIGTIADQMPLVSVNRSMVVAGLKEIKTTRRIGLLSLFAEAGIKPGEVNISTVGFVIAPRLNAMGRVGHAIESLRLLCTSNVLRARELASKLGKTNIERQKIVEEVALHAKNSINTNEDLQIIIVAHETYHEGVIGLAASFLVEQFWRPAIVFYKGEKVSKASARSIPGVNITKLILTAGENLVKGGGHEMAAGFSIETKQIETFSKKIKELGKQILTPELLTKSLKIDTNIHFSQINYQLWDLIKKFEPSGIGNPAPVFLTSNVSVLDARLVGKELSHIKLLLSKDGIDFNAIAFGMGKYIHEVESGSSLDIAFCVDENIWNGKSELQLKIRDIKVASQLPTN